MGKELSWRGNAMRSTTDSYLRLVELFQKDFSRLSLLLKLVESKNLNTTANLMVNVFHNFNSVVPIIEHLSEEEFKQSSKNVGASMRGNTIVNKIEGAFVRVVGLSFLQQQLGSLLVDLCADDKLSFEIDPVRVESELSAMRARGEDAPIDSQALIASRQKMLRQAAQSLLDHITANEFIEGMPRPIRAIAEATGRLARLYAPSIETSIVGGFIMLRFVSPCIVIPENFGIATNRVVPKAVRRNLVLLTKVLQAASNQSLFTEQYMVPLNSFILDNQPRVEAFVRAIVADPVAGPDERLWADCHVVAPTPGFAPNQLPVDDMFRLHHLVVSRPEFAEQLEAQEGPSSPMLALVRELGPSPLPALHQAGGRVSVDGGGSSGGAGNPRVSGVLGDDEPEAGGNLSAQLEELFFIGPKARDGRSVLYVIVNRLRKEMLDCIDELISHVYRNVNSVSENPYMLVIDMSWSRMSREMKEKISQSIRQMITLFERRVKKNVNEIFIVHPSDYSRSLLRLLKAFTSVKLSRKIKELHSWEELKSIIDESNIALPDTSKDFITKAYKVTKINAKGKQQARLIKFTLNSLLNIDPRSKKVQNEKMFAVIEEISTREKSMELHLRFADGTESARGSLLVQDGKSSVQDKLYRRYLCPSMDDKWSIIEDMYRNAFLNPSLQAEAPQEFNVSTSSGSRLFKLTVDSILVLDVKSFSIKQEISFAGIADVILEADGAVLWLKLRSTEKRMRLGCEKCNGTELFKTLRFYFDRYNKASSEDYDQSTGDQLFGRSTSFRV